MDNKGGGGGDGDLSKNATITIRLIRSFEHKNWKPFVLRGIDLTTTDSDHLKNVILSSLPTSFLPPPFKTLKGLDTLKIEYQAFGMKTNDPLINVQSSDEAHFLKPGTPLVNQGVKNETEISFFKLSDYLLYKNLKTGDEIK